MSKTTRPDRPRGNGIAQVRAASLALAVFLASLAGAGVGTAQETALPETGGAEIQIATSRADTTVTFRHADHELLDCLACHETGTPTLQANRQWCSDCHHSRRTAAACTACHSTREIRDAAYPVTRTMQFSVGTAAEREISFRHAEHGSFSCGRCHGDGPTPDASDLDCTSCHEEHHSRDAECAACHRSAPDDAHPVEAHLTCQGSGCHASPPFPEPPPRDRSVCLACHQNMTDHEPGERCADCHVLPPARSPGIPGGTP